MKIVVLVKEVPDTYGERKLNLETGLADRAASEPVLDEIGERALEVALSYREGHPDAEVAVLSVGPESATASVRKGLAMGADSATLIADPSLVGADLTLTAEVIAAAVRRLAPDLVIAGNTSTDGSGGVIPVMVAEHLDLPAATNLDAVEILDAQVTGRRASEDAMADVTVALPAIISITERLPDPRFPNFKGIMAAKKKPFETLSLAEIGISAPTERARSIMLAVASRPPRGAGVKVVDEGDGARQLVDFLVENGLV